MEGQCSGITKGGARCRAFVMPGSTFCIAHDPNRVVELAEYRKRGGQNRSNSARARRSLGDLRDLGAVQVALLKALKGLEDGHVEPTVATAMATVGRALVAVASANAAVTFEAQLADMARQIAELRDRRPA
jgi:hypothetical protein